MTTATLKTLAEMTIEELAELRDRVDEVIRHQGRLIADGEMEATLHRQTVDFRNDIDNELDRRGA